MSELFFSFKRRIALSAPTFDRATAPRARRLRGALLLGCIAAFTLRSEVAVADDSAAADALFLEAKELLKQNKVAEACPKLEASYKLEKAVGTLMNMADCHESLRKVATAWAEWGVAFDWLKRDGDKRAAFAQERRDALTPRLPKLRVAAADVPTSLEVYREATRIEPGAFNVALPIDPGPHAITVRRGDKVLKEQRIEAKEGEVITVPLDLAAIERASPPPAARPLPPGPRVDEPPPGSSLRTTGFLVGGVGVATLAVAGVLEILALSNVSSIDEPGACVNEICSPDGYATVERARLFADAGQWVGIAGLFITGVGVTMVLSSPSPSSPPPPARIGAPASPVPPRVAVQPWVGPQGAGVTLRGSL